MTDYQIVKKQIEHLYIIQEHVPIINAVNCWNVKGRQIGERTNKLTLENYHEVYKKMLEEQEFHLLINDESVISLFYLFDENGKVSQHSLSYIPSLDIEIYASDTLSLENHISISRTANNYIRIDYDKTGKKDVVHTDVHMHFGIFHKQNHMSSSELRIPLEGILFPYEFIYIILKYLYDVEDEFLTALFEDKYIKFSCLEKKEQDKLILSFGERNLA
ncbi:DUF2290 domain-containing protein [Paenibacillus sp. FSL H7-0714]|uniref:DUF2290 domain-containing protein n=1 Tax=Paenibacillus sp. FSL H7-0714 TaxID=2954735 RepID=UPI0030F758BE